jgi:hypothetical protein
LAKIAQNGDRHVELLQVLGRDIEFEVNTDVNTDVDVHLNINELARTEGIVSARNFLKVAPVLMV